MSTLRWSKEEKAIKLEDYKRSNKVRRVNVLKKWGFDSEAELLKYLGVTLKTHKTTKRNNKKSTPDPKAGGNDSALDYVIAFDCTGSMSHYIDAVKVKVRELVTDMFKNTKDLRINVIAFGDYCDMPDVNQFGNAFQSCGITNDPNKLIDFIRMSSRTHGGDGDEFYELVIRKINEETPWRKDAKKAVLLIADAAPHPVGARCEGVGPKSNQIDWKEEAGKAVTLGIQYDSMRINTREAKWLISLSEITGGVSADFQNANGTDAIIKAGVYSRASKSAYESHVHETEATGDTKLSGAVKQFGKL